MFKAAFRKPGPLSSLRSPEWPFERPVRVLLTLRNSTVIESDIYSYWKWLWAAWTTYSRPPIGITGCFTWHSRYTQKEIIPPVHIWSSAVMTNLQPNRAIRFTDCLRQDALTQRWQGIMGDYGALWAFREYYGMLCSPPIRRCLS